MNPRIVLPALLLALSAWPAGAQAPAQAGKPGPAAAEQPAAQSRAEALFARWDGDGDGMLSEAEFAAGWNALQRAAMRELQLRRQFRVLDHDHDEALDAAEYAQLELVKRAGKAAPPLSRFDASKDQRLQFVEYVAAVAALGTTSQAEAGGK